MSPDDVGRRGSSVLSGLSQSLAAICWELYSRCQLLVLWHWRERMKELATRVLTSLNETSLRRIFLKGIEIPYN